MTIDYKKARLLCTASEFAVIDSSKPTALCKLTPAGVRKMLVRARTLADKWREQAIKQQRATDGTAQRSQQKHLLFKEVVARFEARLNTLNSPPPVKETAPKKTKAAKTANRKKPVMKKAAKKTAKKTAKKAAKKAAKKVTKKVAQKAASMPPLPLAPKAEKKAIATRMRVERSGQSSRIRGHVSAAGRRTQAARSARKRS